MAFPREQDYTDIPIDDFPKQFYLTIFYILWT